MKKIILILAVVAMAFSSCGGSSSSVSIKTQQDSLAYAIGLDLGNYVNNLDSNLDIDIMAAGIKDVLAGSQKMSAEAAVNFLQNYFSVVQPAKELEASNAYLEQVAANPKVQRTESGLLYEIIEQGDMSAAATSDEDQVSVVYEGKLRDGSIFDSSKQRGDTVTFPLNRVIPGWTEGMKLVGKGGKIMLYVPSDLAYGAQGPQGIGANQALTFEVDLIDVIPAE